MTESNKQLLVTSIINFQQSIQKLSQNISELSDMISQIIPPGNIFDDMPKMYQHTWPNGILTIDQKYALAAAAAFEWYPFGNITPTYISGTINSAGEMIYMDHRVPIYYNSITGMCSTNKNEV